MGGPIIRSGASPEFSKNWDAIFSKGKKKEQAGSKPTPVKSAKAKKKSAKVAQPVKAAAPAKGAKKKSK